jgi:hypothetical protein
LLLHLPFRDVWFWGAEDVRCPPMVDNWPESDAFAAFPCSPVMLILRLANLNVVKRQLKAGTSPRSRYARGRLRLSQDPRSPWIHLIRFPFVLFKIKVVPKLAIVLCGR